MSASPPDEGVVCSVKNTFLHFQDANEKETDNRGIPRSNSWTPSSSGNSSVSSSSSRRGKLGSAAAAATARAKSPKDASQAPLHKVFDESSSQTEHSHSSDIAHAVPIAHAMPAAEPPPMETLEPTGSALHALGRCRPCRFAASPAGCSNGSKCFFCHHPTHAAHETACHRPSKGVRNSSKKAIECITSSGMTSEEKLEAYKQLASKGPYMRHLLREVCPEIEFSDISLGNDPKKQNPGRTSSAPADNMPNKMSL